MTMKMCPVALLAPILFATSSFALDEYLPIPQGNLALSLDQGLYSSIRGVYDDDGKQHAISPDVSVTRQTVPVQIKYGIADFLTAEAVLPWVRQAVETRSWSRSVSGFDRPQIALKIGPVQSGVAAFVNTIFPVGSEDVVGTKPVFSFVFGGLGRKDFEGGAVTAGLSYSLHLEDEEMRKQGSDLQVMLKPEFHVQDQLSFLVEGAFTYKDVPSYDGEKLDEVYEPMTLWHVAPGAKFQQNSQFLVEVVVPFSVAGSNALSFWGVGLTLSYTIAR